VKVLASGKVVDTEELDAAMRAFVDWMSGDASGHIAEEFGRLMASYIGVKYGIPCNSGSSANLLACAAILNPGDEVITTALNFPTTLAPIVQLGAKPVFIDVSLDGFVPEYEQIKKAITKQTKAIILAHTLGYPFPADKLEQLCAKRGIYLVEDTCDALGTKVDGKMAGSFGDLSTLSFYPAHQITSWEGGMVLTNIPELARKIRSLRDWGRICWCEPGQSNACGHRFDGEYDHKYSYQILGYNLKMPDFCAAIGIKQMLKIDKFVGTRRANHMHMATRAYEMGLDEWFDLPKQNLDYVVSWFGFSMLCKDGVNRNKLQAFLENKGVGSRPIMGGNMLRQPACKGISYRLAEPLLNTDYIHERGLWLGCWPGLGEEHINYALDMVYEFVRREA